MAVRLLRGRALQSSPGQPLILSPLGLLSLSALCPPLPLGPCFVPLSDPPEFLSGGCIVGFYLPKIVRFSWSTDVKPWKNENLKSCCTQYCILLCDLISLNTHLIRAVLHQLMGFACPTSPAKRFVRWTHCDLRAPETQFEWILLFHNWAPCGPGLCLPPQFGKIRYFKSLFPVSNAIHVWTKPKCVW